MQKWIKLLVLLGMAAAWWGGPATVARAGTVTVLTEGFEGAFPGSWLAGDDDVLGGYAYWWPGWTMVGGHAPKSGDSKAYCAGTGGSGLPSTPQYKNYMQAYLRRSIDLSGATSAELTFWSLLPSIQVGDFCRVLIDGDEVWGFSGTHATWTKFTVALSAGSVRELEFRFKSDALNVAEGWYLDDILVTKVKPNVDLRTRLVSVTRPSDPALRTFAACSFRVDNLGQTLANSQLTAEYFLSSDTVLGNADDRKIGETSHYGVTIGTGSYFDVTLGVSGLATMVEDWTQTLAAAGNYYVFVKVTSDPAKGDEINSTNNGERTGSTFAYATTKILSVTPDSRSPGSATRSTTFSVENMGGGTMSWSATVTEGSSWLSISPSTGGNGPNTVLASFTANPGPQRTAIVTVAASGAQGSPKTVTIVQASRSAAWDDGYTDIGEGWRRLAWFGDYVPMDGDGWIWHNRHGFFYVPANGTPQNVWLYAQDMGWLYTGNALYPFLYRASPQAWLWYNGAVNPRWFRNMNTGVWESMP